MKIWPVLLVLQSGEIEETRDFDGVLVLDPMLAILGLLDRRLITPGFL